MSKFIYGYENKILLKNAYEAWIQAIKNARNIKNGLVTLQYKKSFVSTLHNAVELFLKQVMLNTQDYRIVKIKPSKLDKTGEPLKTYYQSPNLNEYFKDLAIEERKNYISVEFSELITYHKELLCNSIANGISYTAELKLLQRLRNDETHFYIEAEEFLNETEFIALHNFMLDFYKILEREQLLPFVGTPINEESLLYFDDNRITANFSFQTAVKNAPKVKTISEIIENQGFWDITPPYELAECFEKEFLEKNITFDEAYSYIESMFNYDLIDFEEEHSEVKDNFSGVVEDVLGYRIICIL